MSTISMTPTVTADAWTVADMLEQLGGIPPERVRMVPAPGTATEQDVIEAEARTGRLCELVDGMLVEKAMGAYESAVAGAMIYFLKDYLRTHRLGVVLGESGLLRILPKQVRIPDVAFIGWDRLPDGKLTRQPVLPLAPDLAVEVLSESNTRREMERKLHDYFAGSVRLVWYIDPRTRTAKVYTAPDQETALGEDDALSGGDVLPGFTLRLRDLFVEAEGGR